MRFLHTADWHVGKPLRGRSRMDEYERALEQVAGIAIDSKVDAVLLAGDVFDSPAPPPEAEKLVYDFFARLLPERIACVVIAGNHDHPRKLGALASLLEGLRIHVRPEVRPPADGGVVRVPSRDGSEEAAIAVLPFVPERKIVDACTVMDAEYKWYEAYSARIEQILAALAEEPAGEERAGRPRAPAGGRRPGRDGGAGAAPRPGLRGQPAAAALVRPVHRPRAPAPPAGDPGPREDALLRLARRAGLRRAGAGQERRRLRRATPESPQHRARPDHRGTKAAHGRRHPCRAGAPRRREKRRLPARPGEGRSPHARPRRPRQGAAPERPRRDRGPSPRRRRPTRARQRPRQARPGPALRRLLRAPQPDPSAAAELQQLFDQVHEEAAK